MPDLRVTELAAIDTVADVDLVMVIDDPAGTPYNKKATVAQVLVNAAKLNASNTFTGDQTVDGDLFVTGEVNPVVLARQKPKIDQFTLPVGGDPAGSRTLLSRSLISGLSLRHDEALAEGRLSVGNYDTQIYQPLKLEVESFQVHTGISPGNRVERLRVHPTGGVTVGTVHTTDPGVGVLVAGGLGTTPLNASQLLSGTVPATALMAANLPAHASRHNAGGADALAIDAAAATGSLRTIGTGPLTACAGNDARLTNARTPTAHATTHNTGGGDALTAISAAILTTGALPFARVAVSAASKLLGRGASGAGAMEEIVLGTGLSMTGTTLNAAGSALPSTVAYTDVANAFTPQQKFASALISSAQPYLFFEEPTAPVNAKKWRVASESGGQILTFQTVTDADAPISSVLQLGRDNNILTGGSLMAMGDITAFGNVGANGNATVSGQLVASNVRISSAQPRLFWNETTAPIDGRLWRMSAEGQSFTLQSCNDDGTEVNILYQVYRDGNTTISGSLWAVGEIRTFGHLYGGNLYAASAILTSTATATGFATSRGTVSAPTSTDVVLFTCSSADQVAQYIVSVGLGTGSQNAAGYGGFATVIVEGASARIVANNPGNLVISLSGMTVQAKQLSGLTQTIRWVALKIM